MSPTHLLGSVAATLCLVFSSGALIAANKDEIDAAIPHALEAFRALSSGDKALEDMAKATLVFPRVGKSGEGAAADYGEGVLQVQGKTVGYYSVTGGLKGVMLGVAYHEEVILFMSEKAAEAFRSRREWVVGDEVGMVIVATRRNADSDRQALKKPVLGFVFAEEGLFDDLVLPGSVIRKIQR